MESENGNKPHTCRRCYTREHIPTHQFVKFDLRVNYLCRSCWEGFRTWFHWGDRPSYPAADSESTARS